MPYLFSLIAVFFTVLSLYLLSNDIVKPAEHVIREELINLKKEEIKNKVLNSAKFMSSITSLYSKESVITNNVKREAIRLLNEHNRNNQTYMFLIDSSGDWLVRKDIERLSKHKQQFDELGVFLYTAAINTDGWVEYYNHVIIDDEDTVDELKQSYVMYLPDWDMVIGIGLPVDDILRKSEIGVSKLVELLKIKINKIYQVNAVFLVLSLFVAYFSSRSIMSRFNSLFNHIRKAYQENQTLRISIESEKYRSNIAHLPNVQALINYLDNKLGRLEETQNYALNVINIKGFQKINLVHGYNNGTFILNEIGMSLKQVCRDAGYELFHLGSDKFCVVTPCIFDDSIFNQAYQVLEDKLDNIIISSGRVSIEMVFSSVDFSTDNVSSELLFQQAELAMHHARNNGLRHSLYQPEMTQREFRELAISEHLQLAQMKGELQVHYQTQVGATTQHPVGLEALIRWTNSELGVVRPDEFIAIAEKTGMIHDIGAFVMRTAFLDAQKLGHLTISVNVYPIQLLHPDFVNVVSTIINETQIDPNLVILEITENLIESEIETAAMAMEQLVAKGVRFSIDDFGKGYSSLSYLSRLPISEIKIDRSYVNGMLEDKRHYGIVKLTIDFSEIADITVVAEGVETAEQHQILMDINCDVLQGYLFYKPEPIEKILERMINA